ncbi:MAG: SET domain-containing protein [Rhizomicrobium sp.]
MFLVRTYVGPSAIHGNGVFAGEDLTPGQPLWQFAPGLDLVVPFDVIAGAPQAFRDYMDMYAYVSPQLEGGMVLSCDHAKFLNHSDNPNTVIQGHTTLASVPIRKGEEITCDYRICVANWSGPF